jgi:hypothetical protein
MAPSGEVPVGTSRHGHEGIMVEPGRSGRGRSRRTSPAPCENIKRRLYGIRIKYYPMVARPASGPGAAKGGRMSDNLTDAELIEAVATEVMGCEKDFRQTYSFGDYRISYNPPYFLVSYKSDLWKKFNPLTNANHWMMVVERLKNRYHITIYIGNLCNCELSDKNYPKSGDEFFKEHKSIGHAVCLAALEAVRSKDE